MDIPAETPKRYIGRYGKPPTYLLAPPGTPVLVDDESKRILIVDDDPFFRSLLKVMLGQTGLPRVEILEAEEAWTAITLCQTHRIDLVLCDLHLTKKWSKNGIGILNDIRKIHPDLPVYIVTADDTPEVIEEARSSGATGHILKPVNLRTLKRTLTTAFAAAIGPRL